MYMDKDILEDELHLIVDQLAKEKTNSQRFIQYF